MRSAIVQRAYVVLPPFLPVTDMSIPELRDRAVELADAAAIATQFDDPGTAANASERALKLNRETNRRFAALRE